jgi:muconolactone delta-isomerase
MITIKLPGEFTSDFIALIPKQKAMIDKLLDEGKIRQYSLAIDRSILWVIVSEDSEKKAMDIIYSFPLIDYMKPKIYELAFHHSNSHELPKLIMN